MLFEWGTYNGLSKLENAALTGMRVTEIPPADFSRRMIGPEYFEEYGKFAKKAFTLITAHAPYYSLINHDPAKHEKVKRVMVESAKKARLAGASIFNMHLGPKVRGVPYDYEPVIDVVKAILREVPDIYVSLETTYTPRYLGSIEEIGEIIKSVESERVIPSAQLENDFLRETGASVHGNVVLADKKANVDFWLDILRRLKRITNTYLSLRFSQVVVLRFRGWLLKKRVPLGKGYPNLENLSEALAYFMLREVYYRREDLRMHIIYTGPWERKYKDTLTLFYSIMSRVVEFLK